MNWENVLQDIEDLLFSQFGFDIYERGMYLYLLNMTRLRSLEVGTFPLSTISSALRCSDWQSRKTIRKLAEKGCIELDQTRQGHAVKVLLPSELDILPRSKPEAEVHIEDIDFFTGREFVCQLVSREESRCFYCLSEISTESCELDHVIAQLNGGNNSFTNIVAACHKCNTRKQAIDADDFLRLLYRKDMLSESEFEGRLSALEALQSGKLRPKL